MSTRPPTASAPQTYQKPSGYRPKMTKNVIPSMRLTSRPFKSPALLDFFNSISYLQRKVVPKDDASAKIIEEIGPSPLLGSLSWTLDRSLRLVSFHE